MHDSTEPKEPAPSDQTLLVLLAQTGDRAALEQLLREIHGPLRRYITRLAGADLADDMLQETSLQIFRKLPFLREPAVFRPWALRIASRIAFSYLKRARRWEPLETAPPEPYSPTPNLGEPPDASFLALVDRHACVPSRPASPLPARPVSRGDSRHPRDPYWYGQVTPPLRSRYPSQTPHPRKETSMSPEPQQPNSGDANDELAFVRQALAAADRSERYSRIMVGVLGILAVVVFVWMHLHLFPPETFGGLLHSLLRVDLFFLVLLFAITMYLRQAMNQNTRTILRALANTRQR